MLPLSPSPLPSSPTSPSSLLCPPPPPPPRLHPPPPPCLLPHPPPSPLPLPTSHLPLPMSCSPCSPTLPHPTHLRPLNKGDEDNWDGDDMVEDNDQCVCHCPHPCHCHPNFPHHPRLHFPHPCPCSTPTG